MKNISILGCGWLGLPLAKSLLDKGFLVKGSTTSIEKMTLLESNGIHAFQITLSENEIQGDLQSFLKNSEILIIDIPPKLRENSNENFVSKIQNLIPFIENSKIEKIIFISSTSVYADETSTTLSVTELTKPQPETESGKQLLKAENLLLRSTNFKTTVIRFGGLIGENRHPIHFLAGRKNIENPDAPINLIHQMDCIRIIEEILRQAQNDKLGFGEIFNAVAPFHPTRKTYYSEKALELNLLLPEFDESKPSVGKIISSEKVETVLGYHFENIAL
ncbi:NAD(P)H-binding protein [Flavobacterium sp.]|jgi:nucleoside-diphosphate-sugar epimerase|uniref:NAD(P)H-binding protein n=1 Tax=Flavobacterium sp. TaxID=239 RepID=UPI0037C04BFA